MSIDQNWVIVLIFVLRIYQLNLIVKQNPRIFILDMHFRNKKSGILSLYLANPSQSEFFSRKLNKNDNSIRIYPYILNCHSNAHAIFFYVLCIFKTHEIKLIENNYICIGPILIE